MKLLNVFVLAGTVGLLMSCSHSSDVTPATQNSLSMVVPSTTSASPNVLLLKDGSRAYPTSGISGFNQLTVGSKLSIAFRTTGTIKNGVSDIVVTSYGNAKDSTFIPHGPHTDSTSFFGTFSGMAYKSALDSSSASMDTTSITFGAPNKYNCIGSKGYPAAGAGTYVVWQGSITFIDLHNHTDAVLNGSFSYSLADNYLYMWAIRNGNYYSYSMRRK
ncbi:MAG TPA: hypothetical protein VL728_03245 [Cyclobacteriaceae bacterium]|jgi:hypothetical protein|nr:hypothetical protein [Cyclobacteriaceae bacterium]